MAGFRNIVGRASACPFRSCSTAGKPTNDLEEKSSDSQDFGRVEHYIVQKGVKGVELLRQRAEARCKLKPNVIYFSVVSTLQYEVQ